MAAPARLLVRQDHAARQTHIMMNTKLSSATIFLAAVSGCSIIVFWVIGCAFCPSLSIASMLRGDPGYYPYITRSIAQFQPGEFAVAEYQGQGLLTFPAAGFLVHGLLYRLGGMWGWITADVLVQIAAFFAMYCFIRVAGLKDFPASLIGVLYATGAGRYLLDELACLGGLRPYGVLPYGAYFFPYHSTIFRPFITEPLNLGVWGLLLRCFAGPERRPYWPWLWLGICGALLLQADLYMAEAAMLTAGACLTGRMCFARGQLRAEVWRSLWLGSVAFAIAAAPFFLQRWLEHPDVPQRLGLIPLGRFSWVKIVSPINVAQAYFAFAFVWLLVKVTKFRPDEGSVYLAVLRLLALGVLMASIAMTVQIMLFGKTIQPFHYRAEVVRLASYATTVAASYVCIICWRSCRWLRRFKANGACLKYASCLLVGAGCLAGAGVTEYRFIKTAVVTGLQPAFEQVPASAMRPVPIGRNFMELAQELESTRYPGPKHILTFDRTVASYSAAFLGCTLYVPDGFNNTLSNQIIEQRLAAAIKCLHPPVQAIEEILQITFVYWGHFRHIVWRHQPPQEYPAAVYQAALCRDLAKEFPMYYLPRSQISALTNLCAHTLSADETPDKLNLIVLNKQDFGNIPIRPDPQKWTKTFDNQQYLVYWRIHANAS